MAEAVISIQIHTSLASIDAADWDACACPESSAEANAESGPESGPEATPTNRPRDPFTTHRFLSALESSGSTGPGTGWQPRYMTAEIDGQIIACAPLYAKSHSQGEYIFDHNWAHAYERAGGQYYPKLQLAVPFTPVAGRRLLTHPDHTKTGQAALIQGAVQLASENQLSSLHITFCTAQEAEAGSQMGLMHRTSQQFHWLNNQYSSFDTFLASLSSRKRKAIRRERSRAMEFGGTVEMLTGDDIQPHHWDAFWRFYQDTGARKWGTPYLTRGFFDQIHATMRDDILLIIAQTDGHIIAGALNFIGQQALYGRYWGCLADHPCLHFELCYYRAIDYAIAHGLTRVEAGAQGEHKLARGYLPVTTHSLHWVADPGFANAVGEYLVAERAAVAQDIEILTSYGPFRKPQQEEIE